MEKLPPSRAVDLFVSSANQSSPKSDSEPKSAAFQTVSTGPYFGLRGATDLSGRGGSVMPPATISPGATRIPNAAVS